MTAVSGSATGDYMGKVLQQAKTHGHPSDLHDIGIEMRKHATEHEPDVLGFGVRGAEYQDEPRLFGPEFGGGALLDVGVYPVSLASLIFGPPKALEGE